MSVRAASPLHERSRQAGARFAPRDGVQVALSYGPVAAEIAACRASAGIADRSDVGKLELRGPAAALAGLVAGHAGCPLEPGSAHRRTGVWWCLAEPDRALVLAIRAADEPGREQLEAELPGGAVEDVTAALAAIELVGPRADELLAAVIDGYPELTVLRDQTNRTLLLCAAADAEGLWDALSEAGRPLRAAHVGLDALDRLDAAASMAARD